METEDYESMYLNLSKRINGGGNGHVLLDRLRKEFESQRILTIQNFDKLSGARMEYRGNSWKVDRVEETNTTYYFELTKRDNFFVNEVRIGLSRVPIAGRSVEMYNLFNDTNGGWVGIGKEVLRSMDTLTRRMIDLADELPF